MHALSPIHILVVEYNERDSALIQGALKRMASTHTVHAVRDGQMALDFLYRRFGYEYMPTPDLILLNLNLPKISGYDVLDTIKNDVALRHIPTLVFSGSYAEEDIRRAYAMHANCYLPKPDNARAFSAMLRQVEQFWTGLVCLSASDTDEWAGLSGV